jgi:hypothetical protein
MTCERNVLLLSFVWLVYVFVVVFTEYILVLSWLLVLLLRIDLATLARVGLLLLERKVYITSGNRKKKKEANPE